MEEETENYKNQRWWMIPRKQCLPGIVGLMHTWTQTVTAHKTYKRSSQTRSHHQESGVNSGSQEVICSWYPRAKGKWVLPSKVSLGLTSGYALQPGIASNNNKTSMLLLWTFCFILLFCSHACVRVCAFLCVILFFILEKEYKVGWVRSWGKSGGTRRGKTTKIHCLKKFFN